MAPPVLGQEQYNKEELKDMFSAPRQSMFLNPKGIEDEGAYLSAKQAWINNHPTQYAAICAAKVDVNGKY